MKQLPAALFCLFLSVNILAQEYTPAPENSKAREWFNGARFGLFIHWGPFSIPGAGEWVMNERGITVKNYTRLMDFFNPIEFNAELWVSMAKNAGMKYIVITSKHHDGFCLWDSKVGYYDVMDRTPFKRDIMKELSDACKKHGIVFCMYHSIMDWHHPDENKNQYCKIP